jgi:dsDNA-binding SOS-regulon protein
MALAEELTEMLNSAMVVLDNKNTSEEVMFAAEDCVQSLLKSMAVYGYDKVKESK